MVSESPKTVTKKPRIAWIDLLETIAIFMVVLYHGRLYTSNIVNFNTTGTYINYFLNTILATCVPLFFFVNGYLLLSKKFDLNKHLRKVVKYTAITIIWYIITLAWLVFLHRDQLEFGGLSIVINLVKPGINHLWFMGALICIYLIFPILKVVYDQNKKVFLYFTIVCLIFTIGNTILNEAITISSQIIGHPRILQDYNVFNIFNPFRGIYGYSFAYFCLGGLLYQYIDKIKQISVKTRSIIAIILLILGCTGLFGVGLCYTYASGESWNVVWNGYDTIFTLMNVVGIFLLSLNWQKKSRILTVVSCSTLGIYLTHMIFIELFKPFAEQISLFSSFGGSMIYASGILIISLIFVQIIRKVPLLRNLVS